MKLQEFVSQRAARTTSSIATSVVVVATALGCARSQPGSGGAGAPAASASASAAHAKITGIVNGLPVPDSEVEKHVNPTKLPVYTGPTATVRGIVTMSGDPPPERPAVVAKIPEKCKAARGVYGTLFREGLMRALADALVTVTGYKGHYLPPERDVVTVVGRDCAWDRLTIGMMFGQRLEVSSRGLEPYMPQLVGAPAKAMMIAVPRGAPVKLYPARPGPYPLVDRMHGEMTANVFVLNVPTFDVTGLDGRYEIARVPPGNVTVAATLPQIGKTVHKSITVEGGKTYDVNLELVYEAAKAGAKPEPSGDAKKP